MRKDFYIRTANLDDLSSLQNILKTTPTDWSALILQDCFSENYFHYVICVDEKIRGFISLKNNIDHWEILQIVIDKKYQRQRLAKKLLQFVINEAEKNNIKKLQLEVRAGNHAAISLYAVCGFKKVGVRKKYYPDGEDAVLMDFS
ncbi:MAG TPA: ribosomal protein S18-alanine N-acetyltransferase [Coxiellaceae bacterium]|nr:ribosomal protein S18-alanine N-acetyltransferase [Coxiellaceae bacterium]